MNHFIPLSPYNSLSFSLTHTHTPTHPSKPLFIKTLQPTGSPQSHHGLRVYCQGQLCFKAFDGCYQAKLRFKQKLLPNCFKQKLLLFPVTYCITPFGTTENDRAFSIGIVSLVHFFFVLNIEINIRILEFVNKNTYFLLP